jgi:hypothetical protein
MRKCIYPPWKTFAGGREEAMKSTKTTSDGSAIQRQYSIEDLRVLWDYCQHDFDRLVSLILWLETLPEKR